VKGDRTGLILRPLRYDDALWAQRAHSELAEDHFTFLLGWNPDLPWDRYVDGLRRERHETGVEGQRVPATFLVAQVGADLVGRVSIRHRLNDWLIQFSGHIGYGVRPAYRGRGHASEILRQALVIVRAEGVDRVLVTCDEHNEASVAVIRGAGGVLEDVRADDEGSLTRRYWIS
jgi:predicted acetyltransferase